MIKGLRKNNNTKKGYGLVEILVVMLVITVLGIMGTVSASAQLQKARDSVRKAHLDLVKKSIEDYYSDSNCYPDAIPTCKNKLVLDDLVVLDNIPCDPLYENSYTYVPEVSTCPKWYQLYTNLEYKNDKIIDKIGCKNGCGPECIYNYGVSSSNQDLKKFCTNITVNESPEEQNNQQPATTVDQYVCAPNGSCEIYSDPAISGCPDVYINDPTCQGGNICKKKENTCHDSRGKK